MLPEAPVPLRRLDIAAEVEEAEEVVEEEGAGVSGDGEAVS